MNTGLLFTHQTTNNEYKPHHNEKVVFRKKNNFPQIFDVKKSLMFIFFYVKKLQYPLKQILFQNGLYAGTVQIRQTFVDYYISCAEEAFALNSRYDFLNIFTQVYEKDNI